MIDLQKAITALAQNEVEFVIVGGVAINLHSSAHVTQALEFCYSRSNENIRRLYNALAPFSPRPRNFDSKLPFVFDESSLRNGTNFTFETSVGDIDLSGEVKGLGDFHAFELAQCSTRFYGSSVKALDLEALIESMLAAGRPKDQLVLPELLALQEALDPYEE